MGMNLTKSFTRRVRQRSHISSGVSPDIHMASVMTPPDVPSPCEKRSPSSMSAFSTPAW